MTIQDSLNQLSGLEEGRKACLFNLIVYTHDPHRIRYFKEMIKMITAQFPCRIIFIQGNPSSKENYFRFQTSLEKTPITCDQILIEAGGQEMKRAYFLLFPLLVPDLPIYLLWGQDPTTEQTILPHLEHLSTRLIFDSETCQDLQQFSNNMLSRIAASSIPMIDMNWARIGGWREIIAQVFDSSERFEQLSKAQLIQIFYNDRPSELFSHPQTQAIYLQAWLASRLGWQLKKVEQESYLPILHYESSHRIEFIPQTKQEFESEDVLGIRIIGANDYACNLERTSFDQVEMHASNQLQCELPLTLFMPILRRSFMQEIFYQKMSSHYMAMLKLISLVKWN